MRRKALWAVVPLVAVFGLLAFWWGFRGQAMLSELADRVAAELTRTLGVKVTVGAAELMTWNVVTLTDAVIYDQQGRIIAKIPAAEVEIDPLRLLWTSQVVESIGRVAIHRPEVSLYREDAGKWNIEQLLKQDLPESRAFRGKLTLTAGQVFLHDFKRDWHISPIAGSLDFAQNPAIKFRLNLRGQEQRARLYGTVTPRGFGVVTLQGQNQDLEAWQGIFPVDWALADLKGRIASLDLTIEKKQESLKFAGEIKPAGLSGRFAGIQWTDVNGFITFSEAEVRVFYTSGKIDGQSLAVQGKVLRPMADPELQLKVSAKDIDPSVWRGKTPFQGRLSGEAELQGSWQNLRIGGKVWLEDGRIGAYAISRAESGFSGVRAGSSDWSVQLADGKGILAGESMQQLNAAVHSRNGQLWLETLSGRLGSGFIAANGKLGPDLLDLQLTGASIPLTALARSHANLLLDGKGDFTGRLTGTPDAVNLSGDFLAVQGHAFHQPFTRASGHLSLQDGSLSLTGVEVRNHSAWHRIDGSIDLAGAHAISLRVKTKGARAEDIVSWLAPGEALTGNIENDVVIRGTLSAIEAEGTMTLTEGSYRGFLLSKAGGAYKRVGGVISLEDFTVDSFNARVALSGTIDSQNQLNLTLAAQEVEAAYIQIKYPYPVQGKISLNGTLTGTTADPEFRGQASSRKLQLNGRDLFDIAGSVVLRRDEIDVSSLRFLLGTGQVRFNGGYREKDEQVYGGLSVENAEVGSLLSILNTPVKDVTGRLNGQIALTGTASQPAIQIFGTLHAGRIKGYALDNIAMDVSLRNRIFTINEFRAKQGSGYIVAKGTADMNGPLALEIGGHEVNAGLLAAWMEFKSEIQGKMNFVAQVTGTAKSPAAALSLEIHDGGVPNATFDELYGLFSLKDEVIQVNQLYITKGEHRASAYGMLPLKALDRKGRSQASGADSMNLRLSLDKANLSILPLLSNDVEWASGATRGEVLISGTLARPIFNGSITVADGAVKFKSLADPLTKLGIDIQFEDDRMNVNHVSGSMGAGTFQIDGYAVIDGQQGIAGYKGSLTMDRLGVRHKYFQGPMNGTIALEMLNGKPGIKGRILFENATINVPGVPNMPQSTLDFALDIDIVVGKNVRAYSPSLYDILVDGGLHVGETLHRPRITGKINMVRGSVDYIGTRFRLDTGSIDFPTPRSIEPQIHLEAYTNLSMTKVMLNIDGPMSQMNLKLSSTPTLTPQEIRTVLALRLRTGDTLPTGMLDSDTLAREEMRALLTTGLRMQVLGEAENTFRNALGLDDFRLVSGSRTTSRELFSFGSVVASGKPASLQEVYAIEASKYIGDKMEITYTMGLNRNEFLAAARYDLTRNFSLNASIDEKNSTRVGVEFRWRF